MQALNSLTLADRSASPQQKRDDYVDVEGLLWFWS